MMGSPTTFWAKLEKDEQGVVVAWHPLIDHCADVLAVFEALVALPTIQRRLAHLANRRGLDAVTVARLCVLVALHDLGKASLGFQAKGRADLGTTAGHVGEAVALLQHGPDEFSEALGLPELAKWGDGVEGLLMASICHHGRPVGQQTSFEYSWWRPRLGLDPRAELATLMRRIREWAPLAFQEGGEPLPTQPAFEHAFAGLVMLADWIGSDRRSSLFPFSEELGRDRLPFSRVRARRAIENIGIDVEPARRDVAASRDIFSLVAPGYAPRAGQRAILEARVPAAPSVAVLEAETGAGKTEAALAWFLRLFAAGEVDGIVFALPTRTAATQIFGRVRDAVASTFSHEATRPPVVLAVPGYLRVDESEGRRELPSFEVLWPDARGERERHRGWAAENPKRFLAGPVVVGTIDQVLLSGLMVSHAHLRAAALLRHLIVVDEVHASDDYMTRVLQSVLDHHRAAGGHALLLSATLGGEARARLLRAAVPGHSAAVAAPYPLLSIVDRDGLATVPIDHDARARTIDLSLEPMMEDASMVAARAFAAAKQGAKVVVLRNTVAGCIETQQAMESLAGDAREIFRCEGVAAPHHSRFARDDRRALDAALEQQFGKNRVPDGCVVIATQTVQQSLDLDADLLLTDLCPIDVLLQRIGRLHRHERPRPPGFERARVLVMVPPERDLGALIRGDGAARGRHGIGTVYEDLRILEATWRLVESESAWSIPGMNRHLVEQALHSERLQHVALQGGARWQAHSERVVGHQMGNRRSADLNLIDRSQSYWRNPFPDERRIPSRLGEHDRRVSFAIPPLSPFGHPVRELNLKAAWTAGVPGDVSEATGVETLAGGFAFRYGPCSFAYDRHGVRPVGSSVPRKEPREGDDDET